MIKLQSSMSKHIPVSKNASFVNGCHFVSLSFRSASAGNQDVIVTSWPSRFLDEITACSSRTRLNVPSSGLTRNTDRCLPHKVRYSRRAAGHFSVAEASRCVRGEEAASVGCSARAGPG